MPQRRTVVTLIGLASILLYGYHTARAAFDERVLLESRSLFAFLAPDHRGATRSLMFNGASIAIDSGSSNLGLDEMLDAAAARCASHDGGVSRRIGDIRRQIHASSDRSEGLTLHVKGKGEGLVACLAPSKVDLSLEQLRDHLVEFAKNGDLAMLGGVHLLRVQEMRDGVFFVAVRSSGPIPLWRMFPERGDAPGVDIADIPRVAHSRRVLSTWQENGAPAFNLYETPLSAEQSFQRQSSILLDKGFAISGQTAISEGRFAALLSKGSRAVVLSAEPNEQGSFLTLMPLAEGPGMAHVHVR